jgi:hypothetical protein
MILPSILVALLATACAPTPQQAARAAVDADATQAKLAKALAGLTPGKPMSCLSQLQSTNLEAYGPTLLYRVSRNLVYRNDTAGGCERAGRDDVLVTRSPTGQLCRGDIGQTFDRASRFPTGGCSLGDFVPYRKP